LLYIFRYEFAGKTTTFLTSIIQREFILSEGRYRYEYIVSLGGLFKRGTERIANFTHGIGQRKDVVHE